MAAAGVFIRTGHAGDRDALLELIAASPDAPRWPRSAWEGFLSDPGPGAGLQRVLLLAMDSGERLAGVLAATAVGSGTELELLLVLPAMRRAGIGRRLSMEWLAWAARAGADEALLEVRASNVPAQGVYEQLGFVVQGRRRGYYREPTEDALLMRRSLRL